MTVVLHFYSVASGYEGFYPFASGHDDRFYWSVATHLFEHNEQLESPNAYPYLLGILFRIAGPDLLISKLLNAFFGALTVYVAVLLALEVSLGTRVPRFSLRHPANLTGVVLAVFPSHVFYSTQLLKDPILVFLGTVTLYSSIRLIARGKGFTVYLLATGGLLALRPYAAIVAILSLLCFIVWRVRWASLGRKWTLVVVAVLVGAVAPYAVGLGPFALRYIVPLLDPEWLAQFRSEVYSTGGSSLGVKLDLRDPGGFILGYAYSFITALLGPLPWQVHSATALLALPEAVVFWVFVVPLVAGMRDLILRRSQVEARHFLLFFGIALTAAVALFSDNVGANTRLRMLSWISLVVFGSTQLGRKSSRGVQTRVSVA